MKLDFSAMLPYIIFAAVVISAVTIFALASKKKRRPVYHYSARPLLSAHETRAFRTISSVAGELGLYLFTKVRLADLLQPQSGADFYPALNKITSKHVDFVVCDRSLAARWVIELDDSSHSRPDRIERDDFVDRALGEAGIEILHIYDADASELRSFLRSGRRAR